MKLLKYQLCTEVNHGTEEQPDIVQTFNAVELRCQDDRLEANLSIAKSEAYNGEVNVEDIPDIETEPTTDDVLNALLGVSE